MVAYVLHIFGRVQGVGFRWFAEQEAVKRDVRGYVRNLPDGRVEVLAQADRNTLEDFCEELREGPISARVDDVEMQEVSVDPGLSSFRIRS